MMPSAEERVRVRPTRGPDRCRWPAGALRACLDRQPGPWGQEASARSGCNRL